MISPSVARFYFYYPMVLKEGKKNIWMMKWPIRMSWYTKKQSNKKHLGEWQRQHKSLDIPLHLMHLILIYLLYSLFKWDKKIKCFFACLWESFLRLCPIKIVMFRYLIKLTFFTSGMLKQKDYMGFFMIYDHDI